jgi:hypothetical protein
MTIRLLLFKGWPPESEKQQPFGQINYNGKRQISFSYGWRFIFGWIVVLCLPSSQRQT